MTDAAFPYRLAPEDPPRIGLVALQSDETIESDFRRLIPSTAQVMVSRVPSAPEVSRETLASMEAHLTAAASLFPEGLQFDAIGYGCTSGTAQIGPAIIAERIRAGANTMAVTEPLSSLVAACQRLNLKRIAFLSPYVASVSEHLRAILAQAGIETPVFGSFDVAEEAKVARIDPASIHDAAVALAQNTDAQAVFLSCTNLRTLDIVEPLESSLGRPVLSSNQVLAWQLMGLAGVTPERGASGRLFRSSD